ncbi:MAG TPA: diadenylate cyclase CdaA [Leptospiraceae bacterium]|jgi:diadenylate cyclase|nr:diadenylate cyclase CdaA [Leptospiraceae bacterium]HMW61990.1 diadenylate cyclase CdaA [Leptospiraceae bacterium]HMZ37692.1 diadenylate cyclase CdaA [Leptospiraceae bacterium]HNE24657.1 diadenylate cyclase CdaA [Leptospiraceae bacterium]HNJ34204.1 diadenylate cyclase CdaA [Leptospiraceae bacterium]
MLENLWNSVRPFVRFIDILIVAFLLYRAYILLSRTRAMQLLLGFGLILLLDVIARRFSMDTLSWLITNVSQYLVFGLIVLLQPELRRLFAEIGKMPLFQWVNPPLSVPLDEIIAAASSMARSRTGSIIVLMKEIRPHGILENSVRVEGNISRELLETIFHKDTPLHDGAVIIEGAKILAASCYLPLSSSRVLKKTLGARHRAALGMSEESDAVILVTSEESGKISVMQNGEVLTPVRAGELKSLLSELLGKTPRSIAEIAEEKKAQEA